MNSVLDGSHTSGFSIQTDLLDTGCSEIPQNGQAGQIGSNVSGTGGCGTL